MIYDILPSPVAARRLIQLYVAFALRPLAAYRVRYAAATFKRIGHWPAYHTIWCHRRVDPPSLVGIFSSSLASPKIERSENVPDVHDV